MIEILKLTNVPKICRLLYDLDNIFIRFECEQKYEKRVLTELTRKSRFRLCYSFFVCGQEELVELLLFAQFKKPKKNPDIVKST